MRSIIDFLKKHGVPLKGLWGLVAIFLLLSLLSLAQPEILRHASLAITAKNPAYLVQTLLFAAGSTVLMMAMSYLRDMRQKKTVNNLQQALGTKILQTLIQTKMSVLGKKQFGDVSTVLTHNTENYAKSVVTSVAIGSLGYISLIVTFVYMCIIEWRLALCVLVYNLIIRIFAVLAERKIKQNTKELTEAMRSSGNFLVSLLRGMITVKICSDRDFFLSKLKRQEKAVMRANWKSFVWSNGFQDFIWAFSKLAEFVVVYGVGALLIAAHLTDISILLTFVFANDLFTIGINNVSYYLTCRAEARAYQDNLAGLLEECETENEPHIRIAEAAFPIRFEKVSFTYGDKPLLQDISFTIQKGEKLLLRGPNGQGKSTILKLIAGLYRPDSGEIYYGGTAIGDVHIDCLAEKYGYISQHSNMLEGGVYENLALSEQVQTDQADRVLRSLHLSDVTGTKPKNLSMGEQQRLNIGRTFYRGSQTLILADEIFANVDHNNRQAVTDELKTLYRNATVVMITHEAVDYPFDRILEVNAGTVWEVQK